MDKNLLHRKERLILTTIEIIDDLGIQGLSTREIARRQNISEATLFRHFKSKNDLLLAVLEYFSKFDTDIFESVRLKNINPNEAIIYTVSLYMEYYQNYPAITSIMQLFDVLSRESELTHKVKDILKSRNSFMKQLVEEAQKVGKINSLIDSESVADMIIGFCREIILKWRLNERDFPLRERSLLTVKMLLNALSQNQNNL